jgi:hypothetical protein
MVQVQNFSDEEMDESLVRLYDQYIAMDSTTRQALEESWRDMITVPAHLVVKFYNDTEANSNT